MSRKTVAKILYNGRDISNYVIDFSYSDNTDKTDDISVTLSNREKLWLNEWFPETGDTINAEIQLFEWNFSGDNRILNLGNFEVDNVDFSETITVKAVAIPLTSSARSEKKFKSWEKVKLSYIASDIAKKAKLKLVYETDTNPFYDKSEQNDKSDLSFLEDLCKSDGLCMKVTAEQLIIFDESKYDTLEAIATIIRGSTDIYGYPSLKRNAKNIYTACEINYFDSKSDLKHTGRFEALNAPKVGHILRIRENFNAETDDTNFNRKAKARLREQNKNEWTANINLKGDIIYFAGTNINLEGFFKFDGKYNITTCSHSINNSGYTISLSTRRCLEGY